MSNIKDDAITVQSDDSFATDADGPPGDRTAVVTSSETSSALAGRHCGSLASSRDHARADTMVLDSAPKCMF